MTSPQRVVIVSASVGAGHDGAALELARRLRADGFTVDCHDFLDLLPGPLGRGLREAYHKQLDVAPRTWQWLLAGLERWPAATHGVAAAFARLAARRTRALVGPDAIAVVSTYPLASQALGRLRATGRLSVPVVTFLTDMSVHPLWVSPGVDVHLALHEVPATQATRLGAASVVVTGPAVDPRFRPATSTSERAAARVRFGLPHTGRLALVAAGSWGVGEIEDTAADVAASGIALPVVLCGRNEELLVRLRRAGIEHALGWVEDVPEIMHACDVVVQNAGGLTSLEAIASGLPVITYRCLPGHGRTNAEAMDAAGLAPWVRQPAELGSALEQACGRERRAVADSLEGVGEPADVIAQVATTGTSHPIRRARFRRRSTAATLVTGGQWTGGVGRGQRAMATRPLDSSPAVGEEAR